MASIARNTKFYDAGGDGAGVGGASGVTPTDYGVSGRAEYLVIGSKSNGSDPYKEYDQFTALNAKQNILVLGGGADYSTSGSNTLLLHSLDAQFDSTNGLGLYAAYLGSYRGLHNNQGRRPRLLLRSRLSRSGLLPRDRQDRAIRPL